MLRGGRFLRYGQGMRAEMKKSKTDAEQARLASALRRIITAARELLTAYDAIAEEERGSRDER
jgi:hypothetical protein